MKTDKSTPETDALIAVWLAEYSGPVDTGSLWTERAYDAAHLAKRLERRVVSLSGALRYLISHLRTEERWPVRSEHNAVLLFVEQELKHDARIARNTSKPKRKKP